MNFNFKKMWVFCTALLVVAAILGLMSPVGTWAQHNVTRYVAYVTGSPGFVLNSAGSNYGQLSNVGSTSFSLGYGTSTSSLGTAVLTWTTAGLVGIGSAVPTVALDVAGAITSNNTITGARLAATYGIAAATGAFTGALSAQSVSATYGVSAATGAFSDAIAATSLDTGQGANELYDMDQNVLQASAPTFSGLTLTYGVGAATGVFSGALSGATLNTGQGAYELYKMDQDVDTAGAPTFRDLTLTYGVGAATGVFSGALSGGTLNSGQGAYELYAMDQNVRTTDAPTFSGITGTYGVAAATGAFTGSVSVGQLGLLAQTTTQLAVLTPACPAARAGCLAFSTTNGELVMSSGTAVGAWVIASTPTVTAIHD